MQSLSFARAASVVRACAYKIAPHTPPEALAALPFIGAARARQIADLATRGTTAELEQHRCLVATPVYTNLLRPCSAWLAATMHAPYKVCFPCCI